MSTFPSVTESIAKQTQRAQRKQTFRFPASLVRRLSARASRYFGIFAVLPFSGREDDRRNDHDERDKDSRLTNPQCRTSAFTRWIERDLNNAIPGCMKRDGRPDTACR